MSAPGRRGPLPVPRSLVSPDRRQSPESPTRRVSGRQVTQTCSCQQLDYGMRDRVASAGRRGRLASDSDRHDQCQTTPATVTPRAGPTRPARPAPPPPPPPTHYRRAVITTPAAPPGSAETRPHAACRAPCTPGTDRPFSADGSRPWSSRSSGYLLASHAERCQEDEAYSVPERCW